MIVLGIETSCDETAASVVKDGNELLSNVVFSSMDLHKAYGGVVPEIAARSHIESIIPVIEQALTEAFSFENTKSEIRNPKQKPNPKLEKRNMKNESEPWDNIDAIAVTYGAGLGGSLLVGVMTARTLALTKNKPLYAINHVEGHVYANFLTKTTLPNYQLPTSTPQFPLLALIVSGGHSQLALFRDHFDYTLLGQTRDDAIGEAFDKVAKITGLPYPGGPSIAEVAKKGDPFAYKLPKSRLDGTNEALTLLRTSYEKHEARNTKHETDQKSEAPNSVCTIKPSLFTLHSSPSSALPNYDFSFSGLKTAVLRLAQEEIGQDYTFPSFELPERLSEVQKNNIAASFQRVAIETVVDKTIQAYEEFQPKSVVIAGGVAANQELRRQLSERLDSINSKSEVPKIKQIQNSKSEKRNMKQEKVTKHETGKTINTTDIVQYTDIKLCTDNGAMIATLGCFKAMHDQEPVDPYTLQIEPNLSM